ncbi:hypothetical protein TNIN_435231 [Trichonephila inaurata madagascariensis]|nr:hypothetical protein TNIN_435231 [Trichonephila inaurata madagascariensis]
MLLLSFSRLQWVNTMITSIILNIFVQAAMGYKYEELAVMAHKMRIDAKQNDCTMSNFRSSSSSHLIFASGDRKQLVSGSFAVSNTGIRCLRNVRQPETE